MDRGYMGQNLFNNIHITNNYFLCRLRGNLKWFKNVNNTNIDKIDPDDYYVDVNYENLKKIRIIKYIINENEFYLGTNIDDKINFDKEKLKDIYNRRWKVEENFKLLKGSTNIKKIMCVNILILKKVLFVMT